MTIRSHVGRNEHPLGELILLQILLEHGQVLDACQAVGVVSNRIVENGRVVLPDIVVGASLLIDPCKAFESGVRHVFLVLSPANALIF